MAGAVVQWLRDGLGLIRSAAEVEALAASVPDAGGVVLVPAFTGLGAPHWDPYARGALLGITRGTTAAHLARAALEGIAFQVADVLSAMEADSGLPVAELRVDGGAAANDLLMQLQADLAGRAGGPPAGPGDHRPRRRLPRGPRHRASGRTRTRSPPAGRSSGPSSRPWTRTAPPSCAPAGAGRSSGPKVGKKNREVAAS